MWGGTNIFSLADPVMDAFPWQHCMFSTRANFHSAGTPTKTVMKPSKRVYDAEAANPVVVSQPPLAGKGYTTGGAPQTVAAPAGASLGTVAPVPVSTSMFFTCQFSDL